MFARLGVGAARTKWALGGANGSKLSPWITGTAARVRSQASKSRTRDSMIASACATADSELQTTARAREAQYLATCAQ